MLPIRTILHPTDFSEHSAFAFRLACSLARDHGARLLVLHVVERPAIAYPGVMTAPPPPPLSDEEHTALREQLQRLRPHGPAIPIEYLLEEGSPATAILQIAQERQCDVIVLGTHGRTGITRLLMGSVAEQVVRNAACPVLSVKTPDHAVPSANDQVSGHRAGSGVHA